jgi:lysozyme
MSLLYKKGDKGQEVKRIQRAIGGITVDGDFGSKTENAVQNYQQSESLGVDGVVGPVTRRLLGIDIYSGVDVSKWNGNVPWGNVDKSKVEYVWAKVSQGRDWYDKAREHNFEGCRANNIPVGGYHFPSPHIGKSSNDPKLEVQQFIRALGPIEDDDMLPVLDLEAGVKGDPEFNRQWALSFLEEFENETGIRCAVYTAHWFVRGYMGRNMSGLTDYPLWVADYTKPYSDGGRNEPDDLCGWDEWHAWQWTSSGIIRGLTQTGIRKCDRNWICGGPDSFKKLRVCKNH